MTWLALIAWNAIRETRIINMGNVREEIKAMHGKIDWLQTRLIESVTDLE
jgi:hypothetical protein